MSENEVIEIGPLKLEEPVAGVNLITMNRPDRLNAINPDMLEAFEEVFKRLEQSDDIRVVILTGAGRGFCSGADLVEAASHMNHEYFASADTYLRKIQERYGGLILGLRKIPQPVIAAVNGPAAGGGFALALAADVRLAAPEAFFVASFVNIGLSAGEMGSSYFLPRFVGLSRASEILFTGRRVPADEAERIGLVSKVLPKDDLVKEALNIAQVMLGKTPGGLRLTKSVLNDTTTAQSLHAAMELENRNQTILVISSEFAKRVTDFGK
ncbi:MAG: enoyl-CoA hydratase/isomerase family protein [Thermodesulfobacteriota bacterium]